MAFRSHCGHGHHAGRRRRPDTGSVGRLTTGSALPAAGGQPSPPGEDKAPQTVVNPNTRDADPPRRETAASTAVT
jgi:hypothetical protein